MKALAIIPARYASTRFPAKPLALLQGKPIIQHVYQRVAQTIPNLCVATDDPRILHTVEAFGGKAVMTSTHHQSGTDRCYEAYTLVGTEADVVVNVQGDEPFIAPEQLHTLLACFNDPNTQIATLVKPYSHTATLEQISNPNSPKVVVSTDHFALYFSRSIIPHLRGINPTEWPQKHTYLKHIGLYAYRPHTLKQITQLPPSPLEQCERLEQLRWLQAGLHIKVGYTQQETIGIDTPADLKLAEQYIKNLQANHA